MKLYVIKNVRTGEIYCTYRGKKSWSGKGPAKSSWMYDHMNRNAYPDIEKFDDQKDWVIVEVNHVDTDEITKLSMAKETLEKLITLLKRDSVYASDKEYQEIVDAYEGNV